MANTSLADKLYRVLFAFRPFLALFVYVDSHNSAEQDCNSNRESSDRGVRIHIDVGSAPQFRSLWICSEYRAIELSAA